jgi:hypothetical protein
MDSLKADSVGVGVSDPTSAPPHRQSRLGISVYFQDFDEAYLKHALRLGVTDIFTSLHIPEENFANLTDKFVRLAELCQEAGVKLIPDISPVGYEKLGLSEQSAVPFFQKHHIKCLRLDFGFDDVTYVKHLYDNFELVLNASTITPDLINTYTKAGLDLSKIQFMHNFYPKVNSGLAKADLIKRNAYLKRLGLQNLAFVPGDWLKRFPFYCGLPTLEKHRGANPYTAAVELLADCGVDGILVGDSKVSFTAIKYIGDFMRQKLVNLPCWLLEPYQSYYDKIFTLRSDTPQNVVRLLSPRTLQVPISQTAQRPKGTITMDNRLAERYAGEIEITRCDLPFSRSANIMGWVFSQFCPILDHLDGSYQVRLVRG